MNDKVIASYKQFLLLASSHKEVIEVKQYIDALSLGGYKLVGFSYDKAYSYGPYTVTLTFQDHEGSVTKTFDV